MNEKRFNMLEVYGQPSSNSYGNTAADIDSAAASTRECVACLSDEKDTIILPCRHMCLCSDCAENLRGRASKCPMCRQSKIFSKGCKILENFSIIPNI